MRVHSVEVAVQKPVFERKVLGQIPADQYAQDKPFVPTSVAPEVQDWIDVKGEVPVFESGALKLESSTATVDTTPYSPSRRGLACAALSGALAAGMAQMGGGALSKVVVAGLTAAAVGGVIGATTASGDETVVVFKEKAVTQPELTGYTHHTLDGAYVPNKPRQPWPEGGGTLHYYMPTLEEKKVGSVQVPEARHSALPSEAAAVLSAVAGIAVGAAAPLFA